MVKRDYLFRKWIQNPNSRKQIGYKNERNVVTQKIRHAKKEASFKKLGPISKFKTILPDIKIKKTSSNATELYCFA